MNGLPDYPLPIIHSTPPQPVFWQYVCYLEELPVQRLLSTLGHRKVLLQLQTLGMTLGCGVGLFIYKASRICSA